MRVKLIHHGVSLWPNGFPQTAALRPPTVDGVMEMARARNFATTTLKKAKRMLPAMLNGAFYNRKYPHLVQYKPTQDPYEYYVYCSGIDTTHFPGDGNWLTSVSRLLICWMAEELCRIGIGNGFEDHFMYIAKEPDAPPIPESSHDTLLDLYERENTVFDADHAWYPSLTPTPTPVAVSTVLPRPPSMNAQRARTLGNNERLRDYLRNGASFKRKRDAVNYLNFSNATLIKYVKQYLQTDEGMELLQACELDIQSVTIDHVWPQCHGGPDHLFNCHLMPGRDNSAFGGIPHTHPDKAAYVGRDQMALLTRLLEGGKKLPWHDVGY